MNKKISMGKYETSLKQILFLLLHLLIIISFIVQIIYTIYAFFQVGGGIAGSNASSIPFEEMMKRRMYGIELWISISGLAIYLAIVYHHNLSHFFSKKEA